MGSITSNMETCIHCTRPTQWNHKTGKPYKQCEKCKENQSKWHKKRRTRLKQQGLCYYCGNPTLPNKALCKKCAEYKSSTERNLKQNLSAMGIKYWQH